MSTEDYGRARTAIGALKLKGANAEVANHWLSCWHDGKPPRISTFNRDKIWQHGPAMNIFKIRENESVRCVKGAIFVKLTAGFDFTNQDILSITNAIDRDALLAWMWQIANGAVSVYLRSYTSETGSSGLAQGVALPFSNQENDGSRYFLSHTNWRPVGTEWIAGNVSVDLQVPVERQVIGFKEPAPETLLG